MPDSSWLIDEVPVTFPPGTRQARNDTHFHRIAAEHHDDRNRRCHLGRRLYCNGAVADDHVDFIGHQSFGGVVNQVVPTDQATLLDSDICPVDVSLGAQSLAKRRYVGRRAAGIDRQQANTWNVARWLRTQRHRSHQRSRAERDNQATTIPPPEALQKRSLFLRRGRCRRRACWRGRRSEAQGAHRHSRYRGCRATCHSSCATPRETCRSRRRRSSR